MSGLEAEYALLNADRWYIPAAALAVLVLGAVIFWFAVRRKGVRLHKGTIAWMVPFAVLLVLLTVGCLLGLMAVSGKQLVLSSGLFALCGFIVLVREFTIDKLSGYEPGQYQRAAQRAHAKWRKPRTIRNAVILVLAIAASYIALIVPWIDSFEEMRIECVLLEIALIALLIIALYFLFQHQGVGPAIAVALFALLGLAEYFVYMFRGVDLKPTDILAVGTAATVAGNYTYAIVSSALIGIMCAAGAIALLSHVSPGFGGVRAAGIWGVVRSIIAGGVCTALLVALCTVPDYREDFSITYSNWNAHVSLCSEGFLPPMISAVQDLAIAVPDGYSDEQADSLEASYAATYDATRGRSAQRTAAVEAYGQMQPSVVVVMNEAFSDLGALYDGLHVDYPGPAFFNNGLDDAIVRGDLAVPVLGGRTCNSEFEFLTGISNMFAAPLVEPFSMYDLSNVPSTARQFKELGYQTTAIHPNVGSNWDRDVAYQELGFDAFLTIDDFDEDAPVFHQGVTDAATYDKVLEVLSESDGPQFIFDVTMQNHGGYDCNDIPEDLLTDYQPEGENVELGVAIDDALNAELNEYLSCIEASDRDLEYFIGELRKLDRPVVLVLFGDHQPAFVGTFCKVWYEDGVALSQENRSYRTQYVIWANYDVNGDRVLTTTRTEDASAESLSAVLMDAIGAPMTTLQKARYAMRTELAGISAWGNFSAVGELRENESGIVQEYDDLAIISYRHFGSVVSAR